MYSDFGDFPPSRPHAAHRITDLAALQAVIADCAAQGRAMRTRAFGHSMNGMAAPRSDEVLLDLTGMRHVVWNDRGSITAGAGLAVWELDQHVRRFGWKLPVINDGGASAPSIGGFIAAGGIGEGGMLHGGFWETISRVAMVTAAGSLRVVDREDPLFPWLFGSLGALGVVHEAAIDLVPAGPHPPEAVADAAVLAETPQTDWPAQLWLSLFVASADRDAAVAALRDLSEAHPDVWRPRSTYEYFLQRRRVTPPLLFGGETDFIALGVWGDRVDGDPDLQRYAAMEAAFQDIVEARGWRRYFQSELIRDPRPLERYVGTRCADAFHEVKTACDPAGLLNGFMRT